MGAWYAIGLFAGLGARSASCSSACSPRPRGLAVALGVAVAVAVGLGFAFESWKEAVAGGVGAALGAFGAGARRRRRAAARRHARRHRRCSSRRRRSSLAALALRARRSATLEAVALPLLGARLRARAAGRYEGLRILAKD